MILMYTVNELEEISGVTRRTIGDYVAKGLLAGPSHRGRGARYSQADVDLLRVIPALRTLMKKEFPSFREVHAFLQHLSAHDRHSLAKKTNENAFVLEVSTLRVRISLCDVLPQVPPERVAVALGQLTPEQIRGVDTGRYQLGAVIDMAELLGELEHDNNPFNAPSTQKEKPVNGNGSNGYAPGAMNSTTHSSWNVNWLAGSSYNESHEFAAEVADIQTLGAITERIEKLATNTDMNSLQRQSLTGSRNAGNGARRKTVAMADRLSDIAERVERLEQLLLDQ